MTRGDAPVSGVNALAISTGRGDPSSSPLAGRRSSFRVPPPPDSDEQTGNHQLHTVFHVKTTLLLNLLSINLLYV